MPGVPFLPASAQPVDLFPQTPHCELVLVFTRTEGKEKCDDNDKNEKQTGSTQDVNIEDECVKEYENNTPKDVSEPNQAEKAVTKNIEQN